MMEIVGSYKESIFATMIFFWTTSSDCLRKSSMSSCLLAKCLDYFYTRDAFLRFII